MEKFRENIFPLSIVDKKGRASDGYKTKHNIILDYNKTKSGVDKLDRMFKEIQMLSSDIQMAMSDILKLKVER